MIDWRDAIALSSPVTVEQASDLIQVPQSTIRTWISRYDIQPVDATLRVRRQRGMREYLLRDLARAEVRAGRARGGRPRRSDDEDGTAA